MSNQDRVLGVFEERVLLAVARCGEDAYGMEIRRDIEHHSGRPVSIGAVYATIDRLVAKGLLSVSVASGDESRGGGARKFARLEKAGAEALKQSLAEHQRMWRGVDLDAAVASGRGQRK